MCLQVHRRGREASVGEVELGIEKGRKYVFQQLEEELEAVSLESLDFH
jgi:hypothetical protein